MGPIQIYEEDVFVADSPANEIEGKRNGLRDRWDGLGS